MKTGNVDLCSEETLEPDASSLFGTQSIENQNGLALFFDPYDKTDDLQCEYAQMAQVAKEWYPQARYLLIPNEDLVPMGKTDDLPDKKLMLATMTFEDREGKSIFLCPIHTLNDFGKIDSHTLHSFIFLLINQRSVH
jgi:hypothetical protein